MRFKKGETGNPQGQIRAKPIRDALNALLSRPGDDLLNDKPATMAQKVALDLLHDAVYGDKSVRIDARSEVIDRTDGKAIQAVEHSGSIARSHEEELEILDTPESNDTTREGDTPPTA
jgi:hypothetical protein